MIMFPMHSRVEYIFFMMQEILLVYRHQFLYIVSITLAWYVSIRRYVSSPESGDPMAATKPYVRNQLYLIPLKDL